MRRMILVMGIAIGTAKTLSEVEDLYRPYKQKKRTRATIAKEKGLEPLAVILFEQKEKKDLKEIANDFINAEKGVETVEDAIAGAMDIVSEMISDVAEYRKDIRKIIYRDGIIVTKAAKDEILKKFTSDIVKIYDEEAKELMRQAEAEGMPDIKLHIRKPVNIRKCVLRIVAMFLVIVFVGSIVIPVPKADAWRVWWLDLLMGENTQDIDVNTNDDFKYYVSELPEGFVFYKEKKNENRYMMQYMNEEGKSISFIQTKNSSGEKSIDNENTEYSKEMIGDFEVLVGYNAKKTEFEFKGDNTIMTVNTDATCEIGKQFIEKIKKLE